MTLLLKVIGWCDVKHIMMLQIKTIMSVLKVSKDIQTHSRRVILLKLDNITRRVQKKNVKITDKSSHTSLFPTWVEKFLQYSGLGVEIDIYTIVDNLNNEGVHSNYVPCQLV
jgi:hypothetical protein